MVEDVLFRGGDRGLGEALRYYAALAAVCGFVDCVVGVCYAREVWVRSVACGLLEIAALAVYCCCNG